MGLRSTIAMSMPALSAASADANWMRCLLLRQRLLFSARGISAKARSTHHNSCGNCRYVLKLEHLGMVKAGIANAVLGAPAKILLGRQETQVALDAILLRDVVHFAPRRHRARRSRPTRPKTSASSNRTGSPTGRARPAPPIWPASPASRAPPRHQQRHGHGPRRHLCGPRRSRDRSLGYGGHGTYLRKLVTLAIDRRLEIQAGTATSGVAEKASKEKSISQI